MLQYCGVKKHCVSAHICIFCFKVHIAFFYNINTFFLMWYFQTRFSQGLKCFAQHKSANLAKQAAVSLTVFFFLTLHCFTSPEACLHWLSKLIGVGVSGF